MSWMLEDPPLWLILAGIAAVALLGALFWRSRESFADLERRGDPRLEPLDRSARRGPQTRVREWIDPRTDRRPDD